MVGQTHGIEDTSTLVMVLVGVQVVDTNGIDTHNLHEGSISQASFRIAEGIGAVEGEAGAATGLVCDTDDLELVASLGVVEFIALDFQRRYGGDERRGKRDESGLNLCSQKLVG